MTVITEQVWNKHLITNVPLYFTLNDVKPGRIPYMVYTLENGGISRNGFISTMHMGPVTPAEMFANSTLYQYSHPDPVKREVCV